MAEQVLMTALSPTMEEGTIVAWNKKEGDSITAGDLLCEVETDKATMDYEATQEGTLLKIIRGDGESARVGDAIAVIGEEGEDVSDLVEQAETASSTGDTSDDGAEEETSGSEEAAPSKGQKPADRAQSAAESEPAPGSGQQKGTATAGQAAAQAAGGGVKSSPLARKLAEKRGIDISQVSGSGPAGRVVKRDIENFVPSAAGVTGGAERTAAGVPAPGGDVTIPVTGARAVIAKRLAESKFSAPHYYLKASVRMEGALKARADLNAELPEKAGFNAFLVKFVAEALKKHPGVNASWQGKEILQHGSIDIGLAVDLGNGLITPIVRNCGNRGIVDIDHELKALVSRAGEGKLKPDEYSGATFTISNLGSFGVEEFTAIINPPGAAILAVGEVADLPVVGKDGQLEAGKVMKMTLSCDHRVIDGAAGGRFIHELKRLIESPVRVLY